MKKSMNLSYLFMSLRSIFCHLLFMFLISACFLPENKVGWAGLPTGSPSPTNKNDEATTVAVDGVGTIIGNDRARARDEALRDAYRMALEKAGINISAYTEMVDLVVIKDVVNANVEGYVKSWQIDDEGVRDDGLYYVTITAKVVKAAIKKDDKEALKLIINIMGNPRFIVLVDEANIGEEPPFSMLEATLTEALTGYGYHSIDPKQKKLIEETEDARRAKRGDTTAALKLAMRMQADVIIAGKVYTEKLPKHEYFEGTNWVSSKAYSTVRAIIAETGEILDVKSPLKPGAGLTYRDAGTKAIKQCGQDMADDLIWNIPLHIGASEEKTIQLLVSNLAYSDYSKLTGELRNMRKVTYVFPRGWEKDEPAVYDIKTTGNAEGIAARLEALGLETIRFSINKIEVRKVEKGWWSW
ncbi:MAG: hypothetical protein SCARUB_04206 [Candidatus Scalindua rubra]|uniref:Flagellar assembly protein T N-terminal domain-containing protein n=1 Tax=Candidatus Scalindua rubra TaxID=1872076 RepID=A0A1E3X4Y6_9BACT|nr:MAG: hypothetical protein SCARUB_04206 [Candidatus Scalindua rubra]